MRWILLTGVLTLTACQSLAADRPARLKDDTHLRALKSALAQMTQTAQVDLGPSDPLQSPVITVLPPPPGQYETRSQALPIRFDLILRDGKCLVIRQDTQDSRELPPDACTPAS